MERTRLCALLSRHRTSRGDGRSLPSQSRRYQGPDAANQETSIEANVFLDGKIKRDPAFRVLLPTAKKARQECRDAAKEMNRTPQSQGRLGLRAQLSIRSVSPDRYVASSATIHGMPTRAHPNPRQHHPRTGGHKRSAFRPFSTRDRRFKDRP